MNETYNAKVSQDRERNFKEKSKLEKELKSMTKRAEKAELELIKAESVKSVQSGPGEALLQDVFGNLKEFIDGQLQCSICNEIFVYSSGKLIRKSYTNSFLKSSSDFPGLRTSAISMTNSLNDLSGLNDLDSLTSSKHLLILMVGSFLAPK